MTEIKIENHELQQYIEKYRPQIEAALREHMPSAESDNRVDEAIEHAVFRGKRSLLPVLTLLGAELFDGKAESFLPVAAAVEFINASFAISKDSPTAIRLLNASYGLVFVNHNGLPERAMQAHAEIVECVGALANAGTTNNPALVRLALRLGAILAGANYLELAQVTRFAELLSAEGSGEDARRILIENFPSSDARTCLIQLTDYFAGS